MPGLILRVIALASVLGLAGEGVAQELTIPEIVVTPTYLPTPLPQTGSSVSVISRTQIARSAPGTLTQLLRATPGLAVIEAGGPGATAEVRIRGAETGHTLVLIDGVRVNDFATARDDFDFSLISPDEIEQIEILRGPQSAVYGSDAIGGVINIITRKPTDGFSASAHAEGGTYATDAESASVNVASGDLKVRAGGSHFRTGGFSRRGNRETNEPDGAEKWSGFVKGSLEPTDGPHFDFAVSGESLDAGYDSTSNANAANTVDKRLFSGFAKVTWPEAGGVGHSVTGFAMKSKRHNIEPGGTIPLSDFDATSYGAEYQGVTELGALGTFLLGARLEREIASNEATGASFLGYGSAKTLWGAYLQDHVTLHERLHLVLGARYDGEFGGEGFLTGRATAVYEMPETGARLRGSIGTGAKRPTAYQIGNNIFADLKYPLAGVDTDLSPEKSFGVDAGVEQEIFDGARISATGFYNKLRDLLVFEFIAGGDGAYRNIANAETAGLELTGEAEVIPGLLRVGGAYTYLYTRDDAGKQLARRPRHSGSLSMTFTPHERFETSLSAVFVGKRFNNSGELGPLPGYARLDLYASYALTPETKAFARVENLIDVRYQDPGGFNTPGRSATVGLSWRN